MDRRVALGERGGGQSRAEGAPSVPEAAAMFSLIAEPLAMDHAEIVREAALG